MDVSQTEIDELFEQIAENGFDFIYHAFHELSKADELLTLINEEGRSPSPKEKAEIKYGLKYSAIHFCSGVEVLFKARLLKKHWTLIVAKDGKTPTFDQLKSGALKTVDMVQAIEQLEKVVGTEFSDPAKEALKEIRNHRNKAIHFRPNENIEEVIIKKFIAWFYLSRYLKGDWRSEFYDFDGEIGTIELGFFLNKNYRRKAFEIVESEFEKTLPYEQYTMHKCYVCQEKTIIIEEENIEGAKFYQQRCVFCKAANHFYLINCSSCKSTTFSNSRISPLPSECLDCQYVFTPYDLYQSSITIPQICSDGSFSKEYLLENLSPHFEKRHCERCKHKQPSSLFDKSQMEWFCVICGKYEVP